MFFLPRNDGLTALLRAAKAFETPIEAACLDQFSFRPEFSSALWAGQSVSAFHLLESSWQVLTLALLDHPIEFRDPGRPAKEKLYSARVARYVRLVLLGELDLTRAPAYGARKHSLSVENCHRLLRSTFLLVLPRMAKRQISDKTGEFHRVQFQGTAMLIRWWKGPPVIVLVPSSEPICIRRGEGPIQVAFKLPVGSMRAIPLTAERKKFLIKQEMDPELIKRGLVFDVSEELAAEFDRQREAMEALAAKIGLSNKDLDKIWQAKRQLAKFQPSNRMERMAKRGLESLFSGKPPKKEAGRPTRISAADRQEMRVRATELQATGKPRDEIVAQFAEEYELGLSYVRRILEDRPKLDN